MLSRTSVTLFIPLLATCLSCEPKPQACLELGDVIEAGSTVTFTSCSENYEFLTWEFSDERGYLSETVDRNFEEESSYSVKLTAYSNGAYRSDEVIHSFKTSYRFIDRFEVIGISDFTGFEVQFKELPGYKWSAGGGTGTFTNEVPYILEVWPDEQTTLPNAQATLALYGRNGFNKVPLGEKEFNFARYKENPVEFEVNDAFTLKMYWTYRY
jgi:hypothetical protein